MSNKLIINSTGTLRPTNPSRSFDQRESLIMPSGTNLNAAPMFYHGSNKVNVLWSSTSPDNPNSYAAMKYGKDKNNNTQNSNTMNNIYGMNKLTKHSTLYPYKVPNLNLTLDQKGNYKLVNDNGKSFKVYSDNVGNYVKYHNNNMYI